MRRDLQTLRRIFRIVEWFVPYQGLEELYREIRAIVIQELDFHAEADNVARIAANFEGRTDVGFPRVGDELSTARVLTTHFETGVKITDKRRLEALGLDRGQLARQVVEIYCQQIFIDGVYHADPHPGNLLVRPERPTGAAADRLPRLRRGRRDLRQRCARGIVDFIQGALTRDTRKDRRRDEADGLCRARRRTSRCSTR